MRPETSVGGRRGFFLALNADGFESDALTPTNADHEARLLRGAVRLVWCFFDEMSATAEPVYHEVAPTAPAVGVWAACEAWLLAAATSPGAGAQPQRL